MAHDRERVLLSGPDVAVRLWWRLCARKESASGSDPFLIKGSVLAVRCDGCGHTDHHEVPAKKGRGVVDRCKRCGLPWASRIEYVVRGTVQVSWRPLEFEQGLIALADLEHAIDQVPELDSLLYGLYLVTDRSYEYVAELASELALAEPLRWPQPRGGFTLARVRGAVRRARRLLSEALIRRGLMARRVSVLMLAGDREQLDVLEPMPAQVIVPADPAAWFGVLQDVERQPADAYLDSARGQNLIGLARSSTRELGPCYRQVPLREVWA